MMPDTSLEIYVVLRACLPSIAAGKIIRELRCMLFDEFVARVTSMINSSYREAFAQNIRLYGTRPIYVEYSFNSPGKSHIPVNRQPTLRQEQNTPRKATPEDFGQVTTKKARRDHRYKK